MKRILALSMVVILALASLVACSPNTGMDPALSDGTPIPGTSQTPGAASPSPSAGAASETPSTSPTASADNVEIIAVATDAGFDKLFKDADYVVVGQITGKGELWNQIRDPKDLSKPSTTAFINDMSFPFKVSQVLKGDDKLKVGATIKYNLEYNEKVGNDKDFKQKEYREPTQKQDMLLFLKRDQDFNDVYYVDQEPHCFELKDGKLYIFAKNDQIAKEWAKGEGLKGLSFDGAKKEMGVK